MGEGIHWNQVCRFAAAMRNALRISDELDQRLDTLLKNDALEVHVQANKHAMRSSRMTPAPSSRLGHRDDRIQKKNAPLPCTSKTNLRWRALIFQSGQYSGAMKKHGPTHARYRTDDVGYKTID